MTGTIDLLGQEELSPPVQSKNEYRDWLLLPDPRTESVMTMEQDEKDEERFGYVGWEAAVDSGKEG